MALFAILAAISWEALAGSVPSYGIAAHVTRFEFDRREAIFDKLASIGVDYVRCDFDWRGCSKTPGGELDFSRFDAVVGAARRRGIRLLPIFQSPPPWADPVQDHLDLWGKWCATVASRYAADIPVVEIWNEENSSSFWKNPNPADYVCVLKTAYRAIKSAAPGVKVALGGTGGVAYDFIEGVYRNDGREYFDIMNVHPYCPPNPPEGSVDRAFRKLRRLMELYGDADKPIWFTEIGWSTYRPAFTEPNVLRAGLKLARPEKTVWNAIYADVVAEREKPSQTIADSICEALPEGCRVIACTPQQTVLRLKADETVDAVFYPVCGGDYPADTVDAVRDFLARGGTLVQTGAIPVYNAYREGPDGTMVLDKTVDPSRDRARLRIWSDAWWTKTSMPEFAKGFASEAALRAGLPFNPEGWKISRYLTAQMLKPGDRMVPIVVGKDKNGADIAAAVVYFLDSDLKGRVVASTLGATTGAVTEDRQALMVARTLALSAELGVESIFFYCMRSPENDPHYSEDHFGLMHTDLSPKPAWTAYRQFVRMRPDGSVQVRGTVCLNEDGPIYASQWRCPDERHAGTIWAVSGGGEQVLEFDSDDVRLEDVFGKAVVAERVSDMCFKVTVGESPVYFSGAQLRRICAFVRPLDGLADKSKRNL